MEMESEPNKSKVSKFFSIFKSTVQRRKTEMEKILDRLVTFEKQRYRLDLRGDVEKIQSLRPPSISSIDHSEFFGRDAEKESLKRMLLSDVKVDSKNICVIPIVGLGGIDKTTLAQAVYNDNDVNEHFELKAWVCVSDEFDVIKVTKTIYEAVSRNGCTNGDLNVLQEKIQNILNKKKFLIVLDDIWNEEYNFWDTIRVLFKVGAQCSKIIVTTRSDLVASIVGTTGSRHLDVLKKEACFKLFVKIVSGNEGFTTTDSNLGRIGKELVKKCKGLPLAVKAIASLLRFTNVKEWKRIAESDILKLSVGGKDILPTLRLSYHYLPSHLKRCFVYCSMFPKDYRFRKEELVPLWMVDNLLEYSSGNRAMKEVGFEYFDDLVSRSFFQPASEYESRDSFVMHDLMVDLANFVSKNKFVCVEEDKTYDIGMMRQVRHVSSNQVDSNVCKLISEATWLRTFLLVTKYYFHSNTFLPVLVRHLRFISLAGYTHLRELPESVGELRHLRHLNLSWTSIQELHGSICLLYNLQTLNLTGCKHLSKLPENFHRLINLRYLDMSFCKFCTLPPLGQLPALSTLSIESCGEVELLGVDFYGTSSSKSFPLLESLTFKNLSNWKEWSPPKANMETFPKLTSLTIHRCEKLIGDLPHLLPSLTKLDIYDCPELASSLSVMPAATSVYVRQCAKIAGFNLCSSLQNFDDLEDLYLMNCNNVDFLPPSSYESLQKLYVHNISSSFKLLPLDSFPNTKNVTVWKCENLEAFSLLNILNSYLLSPSYNVRNSHYYLRVIFIVQFLLDSSSISATN
ncbi:putative disease resistance protein At3g14460 [Humulus lupulus]|uniref:putative disease resistance protein At3g14460 n=1 Tax=Humulus lupulus TaxID=3486 RepID=UPI002B40F4DF|nr:putative disease resistance protein At3g14460 [Humulus lupulus]